MRIPIPDGDLRRAWGGLDHIDVPKHLEQGIRWSINNQIRRAEVEATQRERAELQRRVIELEARQEATTKFQQTPEYQAASERYHAIRDEHGDDVAEAYWAGVLRQQAAIERQEVEARMAAAKQAEQQRLAQQHQQEGERFVEEVISLSVPPDVRQAPQFQRWRNAAINALNAELAEGYQPSGREELQAHFVDLLRGIIRVDPAVIAATRNAAPTPQPQPAAPPVTPQPAATTPPAVDPQTEQALRDIAARRAAAPPHPLGRMAGADGGAATTALPPEQVSTEQIGAMTPRQRRDFGRSLVRQRLGVPQR